MLNKMDEPPQFFAFKGNTLLCRGELKSVVLALREATQVEQGARLALYVERSGAAVDVDVSGTEAAVLERLTSQFPDIAQPGQATPARGRGRPKLGVVSREVTLLPRHWEWLGQQRAGASATLRRLIEQARKASAAGVNLAAVDAAHKFMWDLAGDQPGFEEATRALFAHDWSAFNAQIESWPADIRQQLGRYQAQACGSTKQPSDAGP